MWTSRAAAPPIADGTTALESRAGTDSLDGLHSARRAVLEQLAPLKALHGHNGIWDDKRKQMLEVCKVRARLALTQDGGKATDSAVEAKAYADEQYERYIDQGINDRIDCIRLQNEYDEIQERIRSREVELLCFNSEVKLQR